MLKKHSVQIAAKSQLRPGTLRFAHAVIVSRTLFSITISHRHCLFEHLLDWRSIIYGLVRPAMIVVVPETT
jgi:hypothetical protein